MRNIFIATLLLATYLNAQIIDAKQLFNRQIISVKKEQISLEKSYYGITKLDESEVVDITSRFDGYITSLNANKLYMSIKKGEALYSIYSKEINSIQAELEISKEINKNIFNSVSKRLDDFDISKEQQGKIKNAQVNTQGIVVSSPINGIIMQKNVNNKSYVEKGKTLFEIANLETIWFVASVYQDDLRDIKKGQSADILLDGYDKKISSKVDFIYPIIDEKNKTLDVRFILENKDLSILPSMFGKAEIKIEQREILSLPKTAVILKDKTTYVFKPLANGDFEPKKIEAKRVSANKYEVISGLNEGDEVINNALFLLDADAMTNRLYDSDDEDW